MTGKDRRGKCLSDKYINSQTNLKWQCKERHIWKAAPVQVKSGSWCLKCYFKKMADMQRGKRLTIEEMQKIAEDRGGKCLSDKYVSAHFKLKWQCSKGHIWESPSHSVRNRGTWCPICGHEKNKKIKKKTE